MAIMRSSDNKQNVNTQTRESVCSSVWKDNGDTKNPSSSIRSYMTSINSWPEYEGYRTTPRTC